jgi:hypothetical protein
LAERKREKETEADSKEAVAEKEEA